MGILESLKNMFGQKSGQDTTIPTDQVSDVPQTYEQTTETPSSVEEEI